MPGFILHITTAKMLFDTYNIPLNRDAFEVGNLIPDSVSDKTFSHFRHPERNEKLIVYPDLQLFLNKYQQLLSDSSCLGYYYHLYIDQRYAKEYLPQVVSFYDKNGKEASNRDEISHALIKRTGEIIPIKNFFSDEYYYGDFTKLNTYLMNRYNLSICLSKDIPNPGIEEVDYANISAIEHQLNGYLDVPENAVNQLKVFEAEHLMRFLGSIVDEFAQLIIEKKSSTT